MTNRLSLLKLSGKYRLSAPDRARLVAYARPTLAPDQVERTIARGFAVAAAALAGLALIFWVAANWDALGRIGSFALLQAVVLAATIGAIRLPRARIALSLVALLGTGGLFAYFGQTYQTGADPWQLFALWSLLCLPLCLGVRHDALWVPWMIVTACAITLWVGAQVGGWWRSNAGERAYQVAGWAMSIGLTLWLSPLMARFTGAGVWSLRLSALLTVMMIGTGGTMGVFADSILAWLAVLLLAGAGALFAVGRNFDVFGLSTVALALNVIFDCAVADNLFSSSGDSILKFLLMGLIAAALLGLTVVSLAHIVKLHGAKEPA